MNALATIAADVPQTVEFGAWLDTGRALLTERNECEWRLADWIADGKEQFGSQVAFDFLGEQLGIAPKTLKQAVKVSQAFPPAHRSPALPFAVHKEIARVEPEQRLSMLNKAAQDHWNELAAHQQVEAHRTSTGKRMDNDDPEYSEAMEIVRAWNRVSCPEAREQAYAYMEQAAERGFSPINPNEVI